MPSKTYFCDLLFSWWEPATTGRTPIKDGILMTGRRRTWYWSPDMGIDTWLGDGKSPPPPRWDRAWDEGCLQWGLGLGDNGSPHLHGRHARFAMLAMCRASSAEVRWLPNSSRDFGGHWDDMFTSLATPSFSTTWFLNLPWVLLLKVPRTG